MAGDGDAKRRVSIGSPTARNPSMRTLTALLSAFLPSTVLLATPFAASAQGGERPEVTAAAKAVQARVVAWRRDFHQHPELSNREQRTAAKVAEHLRALASSPAPGSRTTAWSRSSKAASPGRRSRCAPTWTRCR